MEGSSKKERMQVIVGLVQIAAICYNRLNIQGGCIVDYLLTGLICILLSLVFTIWSSYILISTALEPKREREHAKAQLEEELANRDFAVSKRIDVPYSVMTKKLFESCWYKTFLVDDENKKFAILSTKKGKPSVYSEFKYSDLLDFNLYEDGVQQIEGRGMLSAAGALMFGTAGAVVGSSMGPTKSTNICNELSVQIKVNDLNNPLITIVCAKNTYKRAKRYSNGKQIANDIIATLTYIENNSNKSIAESV